MTELARQPEDRTITGANTAGVDYAQHRSHDGGSQGSRIKVSCGAASCEAELATTGGWDQFKRITLGTLTLSGTGVQQVSITPVAKPGQAVMNLRAVRFRPTGP